MIKTWTLEHFKSVYENTTLKMSPLTIFTGANSSGKSTILQSLLLTTQTIQNNIPTKSVILNGHIIKLGTFNDILSNNPQTNVISIGFELNINLKEVRNRYFNSMFSMIDKNMKSVSVKSKFSFSSNEEDTNDITQLHPELRTSDVIVNMVGAEKDTMEYIKIHKSKESIDKRKTKLNLSEEYIDYQEFLEYEVNTNGQAEIIHYPFNAISNPVGSKMFHFLPDLLFTEFDQVTEEAKQLVNTVTSLDNNFRLFSYNITNDNINKKFSSIVMNEVSQTNLSINKQKKKPWNLKDINNAYEKLKTDFTIDNFLLYINRLSEKSKITYEGLIKQKENDLFESLVTGKNPRLELERANLPNNLRYGIDNIKDFFSRNVKYLGPLRDEPKPIYPYSGTTDSKDVGFKGEHTAAVLEIHKNTLVKYISPKSKLNIVANEPHTVPLIEAVLEWLEYMGVVRDVETTDRGKLGHELKVKVEDGSAFHDLTNVGVGVSQVLPILVLSLLAETGSTLIFEQPELHLHPKVQTRLADFFVSMMQLNKQCILETHSEYLINRLRYKSVVSEDDDNSIPENVMIYFVEKQMGKSKYNQVKINKFGVIEDWPKGFFDENEENSALILKEAMNKRKKERSSNK